MYDELALISLVDAKDAVNSSFDSSEDDDELWLMVLAASDVINNLAGYSLPTTVTEQLVPTVDKYGRSVLMLSQVPVVSVDSVIPAVGDGTVDVDDLMLDQTSGAVYGSSLSGPQTVTYTAGRAEVPASLQEACRILTQHLWETQRGVIPGPAGGDEMSDQTTYGVPYRVLELVRYGGYKTPSGVA